MRRSSHHPHRRRAVHAQFWRPHETLALLSAAELDAREAEAAAAGAGAAAGAEGEGDATALYLSPSFQVGDAEHAALLAECARVAPVLSGGATAADAKLFASEVSRVAGAAGRAPHRGAAAAASSACAVASLSSCPPLPILQNEEHPNGSSGDEEAALPVAQPSDGGSPAK